MLLNFYLKMPRQYIKFLPKSTHQSNIE
jgi:hypothetical protein